MSLFERYGGFASISQIVLAFYDKVLQSDTVGPYFDHVAMSRLIDHQTKFIAQVMGGPVAYTDEMLRRVHAAHQIDRTAFDEVARLLAEALDEAGVREEDAAVILAGVAARAPAVISR